MLLSEPRLRLESVSHFFCARLARHPVIPSLYMYTYIASVGYFFLCRGAHDAQQRHKTTGSIETKMTATLTDAQHQ